MTTELKCVCGQQMTQTAVGSLPTWNCPACGYTAIEYNIGSGAYGWHAPNRKDMSPALPIPDDTAASPMLGGAKRITYKNIRRLLLERAGGKCERCGVEAGAIGARDRFGEWHDEHSIHCMQSDNGYWHFGFEFPDIVKIVLITTRLENESISNDGLDNLALYCQRCHLNERREPNMAKARETRRRKRLEANAQKAAAVGQEVMEL